MYSTNVVSLPLTLLKLTSPIHQFKNLLENVTLSLGTVGIFKEKNRGRFAISDVPSQSTSTIFLICGVNLDLRALPKRLR